MTPEVIIMGRVAIDLYPLQFDVSLGSVTSSEPAGIAAAAVSRRVLSNAVAGIGGQG